MKISTFCHLSHQSIRSSALLILEDDVGIVVGHQVPEPGIVPGHSTLAKPAGRQRVFTDIRHMLLEHQRREFP